MVLKPFAAGYDNLSLIFERNIRSYTHLENEANNQRGGIQKVDYPMDNKKLISTKIKSFLIRFVKLHGDLFMWTRSCNQIIKEYNTNTTNNTNTSASAVVIQSTSKNQNGDVSVKKGNKDNKEGNKTIEAKETKESKDTKEIKDIKDIKEFNMNSFMHLSQEVIEEYDFLILNPAFSESLLLKLLTICIFSVHHGSSILNKIIGTPTTTTNATTVTTVPTITTGSTSNSGSNDDEGKLDDSRPYEVNSVSTSTERSASESLALSFFFSIISK